MSHNITEVTANGKTYYISYSELDLEGESDQLYWGTSKGSGMNKMPYGYKLRNGEIVDSNYNRVSKYDLAEYFASI
jgi:hypothetical protein